MRCLSVRLGSGTIRVQHDVYFERFGSKAIISIKLMSHKFSIPCLLQQNNALNEQSQGKTEKLSLGIGRPFRIRVKRSIGEVQLREVALTIQHNGAQLFSVFPGQYQIGSGDSKRKKVRR